MDVGQVLLAHLGLRSLVDVELEPTDGHVCAARRHVLHLGQVDVQLQQPAAVDEVEVHEGLSRPVDRM